MIKRAMDLALSGVGLIVLSPLFVGIALAILLDSRGPIFFRQTRIGRHFQPFTIYKFRSMRMEREAASPGREITVAGDDRITRVGARLRRYKLDELPQLFNIVRGDMSIVGPRPEVPRYVSMFAADYEEILKVRPGLTDIASLEYRNESEILAAFPDSEEAYVNHVLPRKIVLAKEYVRGASLGLDVTLIARTLGALL